jgi:competence protein ComEA
LESSTPPWRVFDAAAGQAAPGHAEREPEAAVTPRAAQPLALAAMAAAILVGALAIVVAIGAPSGTAAGPDDSASPFESGPDGNARELGAVVVDVTGAVVTPGVYHLGHAARIGDAIDAAGGFGPRVDAARVATEVNLAATLTDGQQVHVPSRDDPTAAGGGTGTGAGSGGHTDELIDLNSATQAQLESLPGIGPVTAGKILESRAQSPFRSVDDLRARGLVGQKTFDSLKARITAG